MGSMSLSNVSLMPWPRWAFGPVTTHRLLRLLKGYLVVAAIGAGLVHLPLQDGWRILGLGLMLPGAGFLAHADLCTTAGIGHTALALGALALFGMSLLIWFATGNIVAPPLAWVRGQRRQANASLRQIQPHLDQIFTAPAAAARTSPHTQSHGESPRPEMSLPHLQRVRFALDRALQPVANFDGFEHRDPFQTAALRYQVNFLGYGLALTQARFTPAFRGYMTRAQAQLLHKQRQHRIWSYWALESLWGHLRRNPDPIQRDNIMFTGFVALQMALFEASTGSREASCPGFFTLTHPSGARYVHDHASLVRQLDASYRQAPFGLAPCEPNWIYPLCNAMSACAVLAHDAQRGSAVWHGHHAARFVQHLQAEFLDALGRLVPCRSSVTGLALPAIGGAMAQAMPCYFLNALAPDLAHRQWLLLRRDLFDAHGHFRRQAFWPIDTGNYGLSRASAYTATALAACELGDQAVYDHCMAALESECPSTLQDGVIHRDKASVWSHGVELMALAGGRDAFRTLINHPTPHPGPWLDEVRYPDVLVASAHADGAGGLHVVLHGASDGRMHSVVVAGLHPCALYRVEGASVSHIVAGHHGRATLRVRLAGRTCLRLELASPVRP